MAHPDLEFQLIEVGLRRMRPEQRFGALCVIASRISPHHCFFWRT
jgi:hypothetical protein